MHWYGVCHFADLWYLCSQKWLSASGRKQRGFCTKGRPVCGGLGLSPSCEVACPYKANQDHTIPSRLGIPGVPRKEDKGEWMCVYINGKKCCYIILIIFNFFLKGNIFIGPWNRDKRIPWERQNFFYKGWAQFDPKVNQTQVYQKFEVLLTYLDRFLV